MRFNKGFLSSRSVCGDLTGEDGARPAGIVDHIVGVYHCFYQIQGVQNPAGTTPMLKGSPPRLWPQRRPAARYRPRIQPLLPLQP